MAKKRKPKENKVRESTAKVGVLIHGCHLQAKGWDEIVVGTADMRGRIIHGLLVALEMNARVVFFGTGASVGNTTKLDDDKRPESVMTADRLIELLATKYEGRWEGQRDRVIAYLGIHDERRIGDFLERDDNNRDARDLLERGPVIVDVETTNTKQEVFRAAEEFSKRDVTEMILVSSPTHISRCLRDAFVALTDARRQRGRMGERQANAMGVLRRNLFASPSEVPYPGYSAKDVEIIEPPHRGDDTSVELFKTVKTLRECFYRQKEGDVPNEEKQERLLAMVRKAVQEFENEEN